MKIPRDNRRGYIEQQAPGADVPVNRMGVAGDAIAKLGQDIASLGMEYGQKAQEAEADNYAFTKRNEDRVEFEKFATELKMQKGADPQGYSTELNKFMEDRIKQNEENAPSSRARGLYNRYAQSLYVDHSLEGHNYESVERAKYWKTNIDTQAGELAKRYNSNPDPDGALKDFAVIQDQIQKNVGIHFTQAEADKTVMMQKNRFADSVLTGYDANEKPGTALKLLTSDNELIKGLNSEEHGKYVKYFTNKVEALNSKRAHESSARMRDIVYTLKDGGNVSPQEIKQIKYEIQGNPSIEKDQKKRAVDTIDSAAKSNDMIRQLMIVPRSKYAELESQLDKSLGNGTFNAAAHGEAKQAFLEARNKVVQAQERDAAAFVLGGSQQLQSSYKASLAGDPLATNTYIRDSIARQEQLGIPREKQRVLTKDMSMMVANNLLSQGQNSQAASEIISGLKTAYGKNFERVFDEITDDHKDIDKGLIIAAHAEDSISRYRVVDNILNKKAINEAFKTGYPNESDLVGQNVSAKLSTLNAAFGATSNDTTTMNITNALQDQVTLEAKRLMLGGKSIHDATSQAYDTIIGKTFSTASGGNSQIFMPKQISGYMIDSEKVGKYASLYSSSDNIKKLKPAIPSQWKDNPDAWNTYLGQNARWVTRPDRTGMRLVVYDPRSGTYKRVPNEKGQGIEADFLEITNNWNYGYRESMEDAVGRNNQGR